jgi:DNA-binding XRE family transcriptional regulator
MELVMDWKEFITHIGNGALGSRYSDETLANKIGTRRETIFKLRKGRANMPRQATIDAIEKNLRVKITQHGKKISYTPMPHTGFKDAVSAPYLPVLTMIYTGHPDYLTTLHKGEYMYYPTEIETARCFLLRINNKITTKLKIGDIVLVDMEDIPRAGDMVAIKLENGQQFIGRYRDLSAQLQIDDGEVIEKMDVSRIYKVRSASIQF